MYKWQEEIKYIIADVLHAKNSVAKTFKIPGTSLYIFIKIAQESLDLSAFRILFKLIS